LQRGDVLVDDKGMTLYLFTRDGVNASNCYDGCAKAWPPFLAPGDAAPGDRAGDGSGGVWFLVRDKAAAKVPAAAAAYPGSTY